MMVLPLLLLLVLPKMMGQMDPETQKVMLSVNKFKNQCNKRLHVQYNVAGCNDHCAAVVKHCS